MAQLPPRAPNVNWPFFPSASTTQHPSWVDEFLDFSAMRRNGHRRSVSDVVAFVETPVVTGIGSGVHSVHEFERLDDEQLMSMFSDDVAPTTRLADPPTTSDNDSSNDDKVPAVQQVVKCESSEEEQSDCKAAAVAQLESNVDPKRIKRILANRQSAQRSRVRKLQYISELERSVTCLQTEVSALSPRVAFLDHQRSVLSVGNSALRQRIAALAQDKIFKDAHQEALRKEIERLRQVYHQQSLKKLDSSPPSATTTTTTTAAEPASCVDKELRRDG